MPSPRTRRRFLSYGALFLFALAAFGWIAIERYVQSRIYPAPSAPINLAGLPPAARFLTVSTTDGLILKGIEVPARGTRPILLIFHGNAATPARMVQWLEPLIAQGYGVIAADYRGYDGNPGTPSAIGLAADAEAFYAHARRVAAGRRLLVIGHSLGAGAAFALADRERLDALITIGAFTRLRDMSPRRLRMFVPDDYRNVAIVPRLDEPYFLVHGRKDTTVPVANGVALDAAATRSGRQGAAFFLEDQGHSPSAATITIVVDEVDGWLTSHRFAPGFAGDMTITPFGGAPVAR